MNHIEIKANQPLLLLLEGKFERVLDKIPSFQDFKLIEYDRTNAMLLRSRVPKKSAV